MKINVTTTDINTALKHSKLRVMGEERYVATKHCPIARATNRALNRNGFKNLKAKAGSGNLYLYLDDGSFLISLYHYTSREMNFVDNFDSGDEVEPISFEVDMTPVIDKAEFYIANRRNNGEEP